MLPRLRAVCFVVVSIPLLATCGGTEPSGPQVAALQVETSVPDSVPNRVLIATPPAFRLVDEVGAEVAEAGVAVTMSSLTAGFTVVGRLTEETDPSGLARFDSLSVRGIAGPFRLRLSAQGVPPLDVGPFVLVGGVPASIVVDIANGNGVAGVFAAPFAATVRDSNNNPVAGAVVERTVLSGGGSIPTLDTTGANGTAPITDWRLGTVPGLNRLRVAVAGRPALLVEAERLAQAGAPSQILVQYNFPDSAVVGTTVATPFTVLVTDSFGNPNPGVEITFRGTGPTGLQYGIGSALTTDAIGAAQLSSTTLSGLAGMHTLQAIASKSGISITRDTVVRLHPAAPNSLPVIVWEDVTVRTGTEVVEKVGVWDVYHNLIAGAPLHLEVTAGGGIATPVDTVTPDSGWVHFSWVAGPAGRQTMEITTPGVATRTIGMTSADPRGLTLVEGGGARAGVVGETLAAIVVSATDSAGGPVWHVPLRLLRNGVVVASGETDSTGTGRIGIPVGTVPGEFPLALVSPWVPADTVYATLTAAAGPPDEIRVTRHVPLRVAQVVDTAISFAVLDPFNNPLPGVPVTMAANVGFLDSTSAVTDTLGRVWVRGWHLPTVAGMATVTVTAGGLQVPFAFQLRPGPVTTLTIDRGAAGFAGEPVGVVPRLLGKDHYGNRAAGDTITWSVQAGGGTVAPFDVLDENGTAEALTWTLGAAPGLNTLRGAIGGVQVDVSTTSTAPSVFNIQLRGNTSEYASAVRAAAYQWRRRITNDLPDLTANIPANTGCVGIGASNGTIDDILIDVLIQANDGVGGVLGSAGPCTVRNPSGMPLTGLIKLDLADVAVLEEEGTLDEVVLHEMGHVLGIGTMWHSRGLVFQSGTISPQYTGAGGKQGWAEIGGLAVANPNVPLESNGGPGTAEGHWREIAMPSELMTGWLSSVVSPMSAVTVRSLLDIGYVADPTTADPYTVLTAPTPGGQGGGVRIRDQLILPQVAVDQQGRLSELR